MIKQLLVYFFLLGLAIFALFGFLNIYNNSAYNQNQQIEDVKKQLETQQMAGKVDKNKLFSSKQRRAVTGE